MQPCKKKNLGLSKKSPTPKKGMGDGVSGWGWFGQFTKSLLFSMMTSLIINIAQLKMTLKCLGHHWNLCCINRLKVVLEADDGNHHHYQIENNGDVDFDYYDSEYWTTGPARGDYQYCTALVFLQALFQPKKYKIGQNFFIKRSGSINNIHWQV